MTMGALHAHAHNHQEDIIKHYHADKPENTAQALLILQEECKSINNILLNKNLSSNNLEKIHEISYSLEASVESLREGQNNNDQEMFIDKLDEVVQALHYSSEQHEEKETRKWFIKLNSAIADLQNVF